MLTQASYEVIVEALKSAKQGLLNSRSSNEEILPAIDRLNAARDELRREQDALEQAPRTEWEPVKEAGLLALLLKGLERYQKQIEHAQLLGWYSTDIARKEIKRIDEILNDLRGNDNQMPTLCLCRRRPQDKEGQHER